jgi:hypothetical protein
VFPVLGLAATTGQRHLGAPEVFLADDLRVRLLLGEDPLVFRVPPHLGRVAKRDVLDIKQDFVGTLSVPHLVAGVPGIGQDSADGTLRPRYA